MIQLYERFKSMTESEQKDYLLTEGISFVGSQYEEHDIVNKLKNFFTSEEKVKVMRKSYPKDVEKILEKFVDAFSSIELATIINPHINSHNIEYKIGKQEMFYKYFDKLEDKHKAEILVNLETWELELKFIKWFEENMNFFTSEEKVEMIMKSGKALTNIKHGEVIDFFEKYEVFLSDKQKKELLSSIIEIYRRLDDKKRYILCTLFLKNDNLFTSEEKLEMLKKFANDGIFVFQKNKESFTDEEKVAMINWYEEMYGVEGAILFNLNSHLFTDEEKKKYVMKYKGEVYSVFIANPQLFTYEEKLEVLDNYFCSLYFSEWQKRNNIYEMLNKLSKELKKEDIEKFLWGAFPDGKAVQFYNKLNYLPNVIILDKYPEDQIDKFDKKIWMRLAKMDLFYEDAQTKSAFIEMALSLGIFEKDDKVNERIAFIEKLANYLPKEYEFTGDISELRKLQEVFTVKSQKNVKVEYKYQDNGMWFLHANGRSECDKLWCFKDLEQQREAYRQMSEYGDTISEDLFRDLIAADYYSDNYANAMEFFVNQVYRRREIKDYQVYFKYDFNKLNKENKPKAIRLQKELRKFYWSRERKDMLIPNKLHRIFDGMDMKYKPGFFEFFKNNLREILAEPDKQQMVAKIQRNWEKIVETNLGQRITFEKCEKYFMENTYENVVTEEDKEIAKLSLQSGYTQEQFDIARQIYEEQRARKQSSIPLIEEKEGKNGYRYKVLRLDDPTTIFVGELTNCCQAIDNAGESCMRHSATSENGRVLVVLDESGKVLSQSWLWRNQNVLCFDNIEAVEKDKQNRKVVGKEILDTVIRAAEEFLEVDKVKMDEWKKQQKELLIRKLQNKEITQEEYNSRMNRVEEQVDAQMLSKVTVGQGYTDVSLAGLERDNEDAYPIELVSYTADSRTQFVLAGTTDRIIPKNDEFSTIPLYEDGEEHKKLIEIDTSEIEIGDDSYEEDYQDDFDEYDEQEQNGNGFIGYDDPEYDSGELGNDEYQSRIPENPHVIVFRDEVYRDDTEFYFDIEEKFVREDIKKKQNRFYSKSKKRELSLGELVEEKKELDKKLEEAKQLEAEYKELLDSRNRDGEEKV